MSKKVKVTAEQFTDRWASGLSNASTRIEEGVMAVNEAPGKKAAAQKSVWLANIQKNADKWATNVQVPLADWQEAMIKKGIPALQNAIPLARSKVNSAAAKLIPAMNNALASIPPRGTTLESNIARVTHIAKSMKAAFA